jgi:hypothetical protein
MIFFFNLCNLPEMIKHYTNNSQTAKLFQASCENISRVPKILGSIKKFLSLPNFLPKLFA